MKDQFDLLLDQTGRDVSKLKEFLATSDFYSAPCSTKFHLAVKGGLAEHTMNVVKCAMRINLAYQEVCNTASVILAAVGHDLCKVNVYKEFYEAPTDAQVKYLASLLGKQGLVLPRVISKEYASTLIDFMLHKFKVGMKLPDYTVSFKVEDQFPFGHGDKSAYIMQQLVPDLTEEEALAIRWHMATFDASIHTPYPYGYAYDESRKKTKLVSILVLADYEASFLMET